MIALLLRSAAQARYVLIGSFCLLCGFQIVIVGQASSIEATHSFSRMVELLPAFLQRGLGDKALLLASFKGTVTFGYFHPVVCLVLAGVAMYLTTEPAHEVEAGLVDLVLTRSVPRHMLLTRSLLLAEASIAVGVGVMALGTWIGVRLFASPEFDVPSAGLLAQLLLHLAAVATCFAGFALLVGTAARRWTTAFTTSMFTVIVMYLIDFLALGWPSMRLVSWISPFRYYHALAIMAGDAPTGRNLIVLFTAASVFITIAYWQFQRRDL